VVGHRNLERTSHDYANYVAWSRSTDTGGWTRMRKLTAKLGEDGYLGDVSMNGSGRALATWHQQDRTDSPVEAWAARFRPSGTWSAPSRVAVDAWAAGGWMDKHGGAHVIVAHGRSQVSEYRLGPGRVWSRIPVARGELGDAHGSGGSLVVLFHRRHLSAKALEVD
jgi:hypothetical protein